MTDDDDLKPEAWTGRIDEAKTAEKDWRDKGKQTVEIYRSERTADGSSGRGRFNMLFANVSILAPAVYQQPPQADVRRRFSKTDAMADEASAVLQSALNVAFEAANIDAEIKRTVLDLLLPGRGLIRTRWVPVMQDAPVLDAMGQPTLDDDGQPVTEQQKTWEALEFEHVFWEDFTCEPVRRWASCTWAAFRHYLTKAEVLAEFGDEPAVMERLKDKEWVQGAFTHSPVEGDQTCQTASKGAVEPRAMIWECWDKERRIIDWIIPGQSPLRLRRDEDFLDLRNFFPCTEPLFSVSTNDTMIPVPEYEIYKDQAAEVARLTERIDAIMKRMKVRGIYNGSVEELADALEGEDGEMIAAASVDMQNINQSVWMIPLDMLAQTAVALFNAREQAKRELYEVTGISDILRGASVAGETATAQRIKGNFGTLRIDDRRRSVSAMLKGLVEIGAEIMASKFSARTLSMMTGREVTPELEAYLRNEAQLMCRVDIETDSTIAADEAMEQENVTKLVTALGGLIQTFGPLVQDGSVPRPAMIELMKMVLKPFKGSRDLLDLIGQAAEQAEQSPPEQLQPDPAAEAVAAKAQIETAEAQQDMQIKAERHKLDMAAGQQDMQIDQQKAALDMRRAVQPMSMPQGGAPQ